MNGQDLFDTVVAYSELGDHRSGTAVDEDSLAWMHAQLENIGAVEVTRMPYSFRKYDARWEVRVDGSAVPSIPLFYEGVGHVRTADPATGSLRVVAGSEVPDLRAFTAGAKAAGARAAVIATQAGNDLLCAVNRDPVEGSGLPTLCVAGGLAGALEATRVEVEIDARVTEGFSANLRASFGDAPDEARVLLTTPLSGWFRCAGERGTGIAVCLAVAQTLAAEGIGVTVLVTNGHELGGLGVHRYLDREQILEKAVFHFGASVASGQTDGVHPPTMRTTLLRPSAWAGSSKRSELEEALRPLGVAVRLPTDEEARSPDGWIGESAAWAPLGKPLVSIAGGFPLHHAPEDLPHVATNPALLEASYEASLGAARLLASL
mgnify:CR=1 FL=1